MGGKACIAFFWRKEKKEITYARCLCVILLSFLLSLFCSASLSDNASDVLWEIVTVRSSLIHIQGIPDMKIKNRLGAEISGENSRTEASAF